MSFNDEVEHRLRAELKQSLNDCRSDEFPERALATSIVDRLVEVARPTLSLSADFSPLPSSEDLPIGATKSFGWPDMPPETPWPIRPPEPIPRETMIKARERVSDLEARAERPENQRNYALQAQLSDARRQRDALESAASPKPLWFVAQYDFAEFNADAWLGPDYPTSGRLLLFYDIEDQPWGYEKHHASGRRVLWDESPAPDLERREPPDDHWRGFGGVVDPNRDFSTRLSFRKSLSVPPAEAILIDSARDPTIASPETDPLLLLCSRPESEADETYVQKMIYWDASLSVNRDSHRIGGFPSQVQDEMRSECVETADFPSHPEDWMFLLQHRDDDHYWGDDGLLFLWIHREDLRARRFDRVHLTLQCS